MTTTGNAPAPSQAGTGHNNSSDIHAVMAGANNRPSAAVADDGDIDAMLARFERNDSGNAERLIRRHGEDLIYVDQIGWHVWDRRIWEREQGGIEVQRRAIQTARSVQLEAPHAADALAWAIERGHVVVDDPQKALGEARKKHSGWGVQSGNAARLNAMTEVAKVGLTKPAAAMDADPYLFSLGNGTLSLPRRGVMSDADQVRLREHRRADLISRIGRVAYNPAAECAGWQRFLTQVQPDPAMRLFLQTYMGYCLTGLCTEQVLLVMYGGGANGKSTFMEVLAHILGSYAATVPIQTFMFDQRRGGGDATPDLARLPGVRLVTAAEPEVGSRLSESLVKTITGGEQIAARKLYEDQFTFTPQFKLILSCNQRPRVIGSDEGIWRRILLVPWETTIPEHERDRGLVEKLKQEASGILNWLLDGARLWAERGIAVPEPVRAATREYREDSDPVGQFLETNVEKDPAAPNVSAKELYDVFVRWCRKNGLEPFGPRAFGKAVAGKGWHKVKSSVMQWQGMAILDWHESGGGSDDPPPPDDDGR